MTTLHDFLDRYLVGRGVAFVYDDGYRSWSYRSDEVRAAAEAFAGRLRDASVGPGDRVVIWGENRPEWAVAFWGCVLVGVAVVPVDSRSSATLAERLAALAQARGMIVGDTVHPPDPLADRFIWPLREIAMTAPAPRSGARAAVTPDTVAEIVFTSGTTGEPKGVVLTHRNIIANITAFEAPAKRYSPYLVPLRPLRLLSLLPLSHMFGQALSLFLPPLIRATTVFVSGYNPDEVIRQIRKHRITLAVTVPRVLALLSSRLRHLVPSAADPPRVDRSVPARLWRYRAAHRVFRWRFCGFVVGGAALDANLENYWRRLGFAVIQGYGLTETAPIVTWNDPFAMRHGTVGKPIEGADVRIGADGEVLVRGDVVSAGYFEPPGSERRMTGDGWLHTGDLGAFDAAGHLQIIGRKTDVIVAADGVKVFPEDVERVLNASAGVVDCAVVGRHVLGSELVHAVFVLESGADAGAIVREANSRLESHQRVREFSTWPARTLPRTEAMGKLKRYAIRDWVEGRGKPAAAPAGAPADPIDTVLADYLPGGAIPPGATFDELGVSSLDRIEMMSRIEEQAGVALSEAAIGGMRTVADLRQAVHAAESGAAPMDRLEFPRWQRSRLARVVRLANQRLWILPAAGRFFDLTVNGVEHLRGLTGPVLFTANHQSHFDTPVILAALPPEWRRRLAVPAWKEYFDAHFFPARHSLRERLGNSAAYYAIALFFNGFPLPVSEPGMRETLRYIGELASGGFSILLFPEGERTVDGRIGAFQPGVGLIASQLRLPVVPVRLEGVDRVLHRTWRWPRRGKVVVSFGPPLTLGGTDHAALARTVEQAVRHSAPG